MVLKSTPISQRAADGLRQRILSGDLPPGSRLPSERELTEEFGISRTALRDALAALEGMGLVEAHVGRGRFVTGAASTSHSLAAASNWLLMHRTELEDLNEVRRLLEPAAVARIPAEALESVIRKTSTVLAQQRAAITVQDWETCGRLDVAFHTALVEQTASLPLRTMTEALIASSEEASTAVYQAPGAAAHSVWQHAEILAAARDGHVDRLKQLVEKHQRSASRFAFDHTG
jgi:GntR family transcriptional repressor for pyruvate dehydrogenase complex